jgi:hypothetical protein
MTTLRRLTAKRPAALAITAVAVTSCALLGGLLVAGRPTDGTRTTSNLLAAAVPAGSAVGGSSTDWPLTECGTYSGKGCWPTTARVDLQKPTFSHSTDITNPLFPISRLHSVVLLGRVDGKPFRAETTLLPGTATVIWDGTPIRVLRSQYLAYLDGRVEELAIDRYAQADDGSVWYLGEDVYDYHRGSVTVTEGTWLAGRDGPPAMIMPAHPKVGDVFRSENVIGVVFEEMRVSAINQTVKGPHGSVTGAIIVQELGLDGGLSDKVFAPGYGEFSTETADEVEALAIAVPTDALNTPAPAELTALTASAWGIAENARLQDWPAAEATIKRMNARWQTLRTQKPPPLVAARMTKALATLNVAVRQHQSVPVTRTAIDVALSALDLQLRHRRPDQIDVERIHLHSQLLRVHAAAKDAAGVAGEVAVLEWLRDRITDALQPAGQQEIDTRLSDLRAASDARNLPAAADHAARLASRTRELTVNPTTKP